MHSDVSRRRVLALASGAAVPLAGCTNDAPQQNNYALPEECSGPSYRLYARAVADPENATVEEPLVPSELPPEQRQILDQTIEDGRYFECDSPSETLESFERHISDQMERGKRETAYVSSEDELYRLEYCQLDECTG